MLSIRPTNQYDRALLFIQTLLNNTDEVTKVADNSVLAGIAQGVGKISGKSEKDVALALSTLFPDSAYGSNLDVCSDTFGIASRFGASQSSTYIRLVANSSTQYLANTHIFTSKDGIQFQLENNVTVGNFGFAYAKVRSIDSGLKTNVNPGAINNVSPQPVGHKYVVNEYMAQYGRDIESDELFRRRIKDGSNVLATHTIALLEQVFMKINNNVLRVFYQGINDLSQIKLAIVTQNGIDLNQSELDDILDLGNKFFGLSQFRPYNTTSYGIVLSNIQWQPIDISFRTELFQNVNSTDVRKEIQIRISKYLDFRNWKPGQQVVEWDNILEIVKSTPGVKYVPDQYMYPNTDVPTDKNKLPRLRAFLMLDLAGSILENFTGADFNDVFYPQVADFSLQSTVLTSI